MKIIHQSHEILHITPSLSQLLEVCGRKCYKSEEKITVESAQKFVEMIKSNQHESVLEHSQITVNFITNRGVTHELVRHRLASFSQESTRYCNYSKDKFDNQVTFIYPQWVISKLPMHVDNFYSQENEDYRVWKKSLEVAEESYLKLLELGRKPQDARGVLPNDLKTEIAVTANVREWRHILTLRTSNKAHPDIRALMIPLLEELKTLVPIIFDDIMMKEPKNIYEVLEENK